MTEHSRRDDQLSDGDGRTRTRRADMAFYAGFGLYALVAVALLTFGALSVLADASPAIHDLVHRWSEGRGPIAQLWRGVEEAAPHVHGGAHAALDFGFSALNFGVGILLLWLRPRNWTARLLAVGMVGTAAAFNLDSHALFVVAFDFGPARLVTSLHFVLHAVSGAAFLHGLLAFPDGELPGRWARRLVKIVWGLVVLESISSLALGAGPMLLVFTLAMSVFVELPPGIDDATVIGVIGAADTLFFVGFFGLLIPALGLAVQVRRFRAGITRDQTQQIRVLVWALTLAFAIGLAFFAATVLTVLGLPDTAEALHELETMMFRVTLPLLSVVPVALVVGILRYRLWNVDVVVRRLLVYGVLTGTLTAVYVASVTVLTMALRPITHAAGGDLVPVLSTILVAALFLPARRRIQTWIDRRLYRRRYDAQQAVEAFGDRLRRHVDLPSLTDELLDSVEETVEPRSVSVIVVDDEDSP